MNGSIFTLAVIFILNLQSISAQIIEGKVLGSDKKGLEGVNVHYLNSKIGTTTLEDGSFVLKKIPEEQFLVVSYTGYVEDTIDLQKTEGNLVLQLNEGLLLNEVSIQSSRTGHSFSLLDPQNIESLNSNDFRKAACCSLAESFQTSNTVDVAYSNAVVGNKEIQLLGLRGIYTQMLIENRPAFTGILSSFGYDFIPGTWLQQINIQKGASSALHGAQSMTGAINTGLVKPEVDDPLFVNAYGDYHGRFEANVHLNRKWNAADHSGLYLHASRHSGFRDHNNDGFYDDAKTKLLNGLWRNIFFGESWEGQVNIQALYNTRDGGQTSGKEEYQFYQNITHYNANGNLGYVGFNNTDQSTGSIYDLSYSKLIGQFGLNSIEADEKHAYIQIMYKQSFQDNTHEITTGPIFNYNRSLESWSVNSNNFERSYEESTPGIVGEYSYKFGEGTCADVKKFILTTSQRVDYLKLNKWFWTPRFSLRYNINDVWTSRLSTGRGFRFFRLATDNINLLVTNRQWLIDSLPEYESSWNYGINFVGKPFVFHKESEFNFDAYVTKFENQLVVDQDMDFQNKPSAHFYSLNGNSRAISISGSYKIILSELLSVKSGLRYQDNKIQLEEFREQVMIPRWRGLLSVDLNFLDNRLQWNITSHYVGKMRLPDKNSYPHELIHEHQGYSSPYILIQSQVNYLRKNWDLYFGIENISNYTQHEAIISASNPTSNFFNANEVYAPINGIKPYIGVKFRVKN